MVQVSLLAIFRIIGFTFLTSFSCLSFAGKGCQEPSDSDLPACLSLTDHSLNEVYGDLISINFPLLDEKEKIALKSEERNWISHRNAVCQLDRTDAVSSIEAKDVAKARCIVAITNERVSQLQGKKKEKELEIDKTHGYVSRDSVTHEIPEAGKTVTDFVPPGYLIYEKVEADFNRDGLIDVAIVLRPTLLREFDQRPLLMLMAAPNGGYVLSARNDNIAPTGLGGGIANPHGANVLKLKGRSLFVHDYGGAGSVQSGIVHEFEFQRGEWLLVSTETWTTNTSDDIGACSEENAPRPPDGWHCPSHEIINNFKTGQQTNLWTLMNDVTNQKKIKKVQVKVERQELRRFEDVSSDE